MSQKLQKAALSISFNPKHLIGNQYEVKVHSNDTPKDRAEMLLMLQTHINHMVNAMAAMMGTAIRDFGVEKSMLFNEAIQHLTKMRDDPFAIIEFIPPNVQGKQNVIAEYADLTITYDPTKPIDAQYEMCHETYLKKPETKDEVLEVLLTDVVHITNGVVCFANRIIKDFGQNRFELYNQMMHQLVLIRGFGLDLTKELPIFAR